MFLGGGFRDRILDGSSEVSEKKIVPDTEKGALLHIIVRYPPPTQPPFIAYNIAQYIFPTTPFIAIKYWQYLVRANTPYPSLSVVSATTVVST